MMTTGRAEPGRQYRRSRRGDRSTARRTPTVIRRRDNQASACLIIGLGPGIARRRTPYDQRFAERRHVPSILLLAAFGLAPLGPVRFIRSETARRRRRHRLARAPRLQLGDAPRRRFRAGKPDEWRLPRAQFLQTRHRPRELPELFLTRSSRVLLKTILRAQYGDPNAGDVTRVRRPTAVSRRLRTRRPFRRVPPAGSSHPRWRPRASRRRRPSPSTLQIRMPPPP